MAVFICTSCSHIQEVSNDYIGKQAKCPKCKHKDPIHNTVNYIQKLKEKFLLQTKQLANLQEELQHTLQADKTDDLLEVFDALPMKTIEDINIHNTDLFSKETHYAPIVTWFKNKNITTTVDPKMMDTTGFFDEIAISIGEQYHIIGSIISQIKYIQGKKYDTVKIVMSKKDNKEIKQITDFCKLLYSYSFIAKYYYKKQDKVAYLTLQEIPKIKAFFNGIWMEWFVLMKLLELFTEKNITPPIVRGINISFSQNNTNELDIFFLTPAGEPVCIECKTGEFREDLNKYFSLQKKLSLKKENFILCVFGLTSEQATGLTSMYDITVVNETTLISHIKDIL